MMALLASVSAYLRLNAAGVGCVPWPACYQEQSVAAERQHHPVARLTHRVLAAGLGILVVVVVFAAVAMRPRRPVLLWTALLVLASTVILAGLGRVTPTATGAGVAAANLLGGMGLAALLWWLALHATRGPERVPQYPQWPAVAMLALVLAQLSLGAIINTTRATLACPTLPLCASIGSDMPEALHVAHRLTAAALLAAAGILVAIHVRRGGRALRATLALAALVLIQGGSGAMMVALGFPLWLTLAHHAGALLLLLAAVSVLAG